MRDDIRDRIRDEAQALEEEIISFREQFHRHPELSLKEKNTSAFIETEIRGLGLPVERVGDYGLITVLKGSGEGKTVLLRADMDALPVDESETNLKEKKRVCSEEPGVAHACGHDAHMAMMLGALKVLWRMKEELKGTVVFAFEQAEELGKGILPMVEALEKYSIDTCFGIHVYAELEEGKFSIQAGPRMAAITAFTVKVNGRGGHGSRPDLAVNPLMCTANILVNLNNIWTQELDPTKVVTMGITAMKSGEKGNVIADSAEFSGSLRYMDVEEGKKAFAAMQRVCGCVAEAHRCTVEYPKIFESPHVVYNDEECTAIARKAVREVLGESHLQDCPMWFATESMSVYQEKYPGVFAFLGIKKEEKGYGAGHHTREFDLNEEVLKYGTMAAAAYVFDYTEEE